MSARRRGIWLLLFKCSSQADESISLSCPAMTTSTVSTRAASPGMSSRRASANASQISHTCACGNNATLQSSACASPRSNIFTGDNKMSNCSVKILAYIFSWMYKTLPLVADFPLKKRVLNGNLNGSAFCCCSLFEWRDFSDSAQRFCCLNAVSTARCHITLKIAAKLQRDRCPGLQVWWELFAMEAESVQESA